MTPERLDEIAQRKGRNMGFQTVRILISPEERDELVAMARQAFALAEWVNKATWIASE